MDINTHKYGAEQHRSNALSVSHSAIVMSPMSGSRIPGHMTAKSPSSQAASTVSHERAQPSQTNEFSPEPEALPLPGNFSFSQATGGHLMAGRLFQQQLRRESFCLEV